MRIVKSTKALLLMCLLLGAAMSLHAATYTLTCDAARSGSITIALTGYNVAVTGSGDSAATGKGIANRDYKFALTVQTDSGRDYETLLSMVEDGEVLRSCKLVDGEGGAGTAAKDDWTQMSVTKGKNNKGKNNAPAASSTGGALEWILTNATVTSVTATGAQSTTGAPTTTLQATIEAQTFSFAM